MDAWTVTNKSPENAAIRIVIKGVSDRTVRPTVFCPFSEDSIFYDGLVPDSETLVRVHQPVSILDLLETEATTHSWNVASAMAAIKSYQPAFWALPSLFLTSTAAAGSVGLINSIGNLGGFLGPNLIARLKSSDGSFSGGMLAMAITLAAGSVLALRVRHDPKWERG